eukprot:m.75982 g.75982  ORF g.75982 m.75982 type:complete len:667 (+) comp35964_c0_seq8:121-2121(+)
MDREKRSELLLKVETQQEQISRYETRFRDVVKAYKSVLKEKEALESTVRALSTPSSSNEDAQVEEQEETVSDNRLATLTSALTTLTDEKSKMAADFQADKKQMKARFEVSVRAMAEEKEEAESSIRRLSEEVDELKRRLRQQQVDLEGEMNDHVAMLRELQQVLAKEREEKEELEMKYEELEQHVDRIKEKEEERDDEKEEHMQKISLLTAEISELKKKVHSTEATSRKPRPLMLQMQKEIADLKALHSASLLAEHQRTTDAEKHIGMAKQLEEERVSSLESRVSELSEIIGNNEKIRANDRALIQNLRADLAQLESERIALLNKNEGAALADQVSKLKALLAEANLKLEQLKGDEGSIEDYKKEYDRLRQELRQFKQRTSEFKTRKKNSESEELLKERDELRHQIDSKTTQMEQKETVYRKEIQELYEERHLLQRKHHEALDAAEQQYQSTLADLQQSVQNTRERTRALLADKEAELQEMKSRLLRRSMSYIEDWEPEMCSPNSPTKTMSYSEILKTKKPLSRPGSAKQVGADAAVRELLSLPTLVGSQTEVALLHYAQQQSKRESEMGSMRQERLQLEQALRDIAEREDKYVEQLALLKEEVRKLERDRSRETANLEYLKNVVFKLMLSDPRTPGYSQILNAVATILRFSPQEVERIRKPKGWW